MKKQLLLLLLFGVSLLASAQAPIITSFTPTKAKPGDAVILTGTHFNTNAGNNVVFFGAAAATATTATSSSITVVVPTGASYGNISVLNTQISLTGSSSQYFNPTFTPNKGAITLIDIEPKQDFATGSNPFSVAISDLDGDGKPDLVVANEGSSSISVFRNTSTSGTITASSFTTKQDFVTGALPYTVATGDLDGDGKPDLVVSSIGSNRTVSIFRNTSTLGSLTSSSFTAKLDLPYSIDGAYFVAIGDLNEDGKPELVVTNTFDNSISIYRNTSIMGSLTTSSFAAGVRLVTLSDPRSVAIGDLDGDGKPDLAVTNYQSDKVSIFRNNIISGSIVASSFDTRVDFITGLNPRTVVIGDLDGDGKPELAVTNYTSNSVSVFQNTSTLGAIDLASFAAKQDFSTGLKPRSLAIGDLDGDGKPDLAIANTESNSISVLRNTSLLGSITASSFVVKQDFATAIFANSLAIGDLDGDGKPDLAVVNTNSNSVSVLRNNPTFIPTITNVSPLNANVGATITITGTNFNTTAGNNVVFFGAVATVPTTATASSITVAVPTGASYGMLSVLNTQNSLTGSGNQYFNPTFTPNKGAITINDMEPKQDFTTGTNPISVAIGDLDGDGKPDLAVINSVAATVSLFRNTSTSGSMSASSFTAKQDFTTGNEPRDVAIGDLDGDGKPDLAVTNFSSSTVSVFRNTSSSGSLTANSFTAKQDFTTGTAPISLAIGDLDGDGKPDLAIGNYGSNRVSVFRNTSTSGSLNANSFTAKQDFTTGTRPISLAIGDLDGDGKPDLAVANYGSNTVSVFRNTSTSGSLNANSFTAKQDFTTGTSPISLAIGDLDEDGMPELTVSNSLSNTISVFRNTSTSGNLSANSFTAKQDFATGTAPRSVAIGDIDGDGKPDLAVVNYGAVTVSVFRNTSSSGSLNSNSFMAKQDFTTGMVPISLAIGDLDGDGKSDLVVANYDENTFSVLRNTSINADLSALTLSNGTLSPSFASGTIAYTATVSNSTTGITVTPTKSDANASIQVQLNNGGYATVTNGSASAALALNVGSNTIDVKVTAEDINVVKTYTVTVTRAKADQVITFPALSAKNTTSPDFEPGATTDSGLALTYTSSNPLVATVYQDNTDGDKWKIHILTEGTTDITANQAGDATYNSSSALQELVVGTVLPVSQVDYQAKIQNSSEVLLTWTTASEANNAGFEIWKSTNGNTFTKLTFVKGAGNSNSANVNSYVDLSPSNGTNYYKLVQVDKDGTKSDKGVKAVNFSFGESNEVSVYPNPTSDLINITFKAGLYQTLNIIDLSGKVLVKKNILATETKAIVSLSAFPDSVYILQLTGKNGTIAEQVLKK